MTLWFKENRIELPLMQDYLCFQQMHIERGYVWIPYIIFNKDVPAVLKRVWLCVKYTKSYKFNFKLVFALKNRSGIMRTVASLQPKEKLSLLYVNDHLLYLLSDNYKKTYYNT